MVAVTVSVAARKALKSSWLRSWAVIVELSSN